VNCELRTNKAFTLIEVVAAVAILAMVISFASVIFGVSIEAYRTSVANTEIMQKLRAITDQLNADFKGQMWSPPGKINFGFDSSDSIVFFASGDFQSTRQYDGRTVVGNVACIYYGLADTPTSVPPREKILVRRQTILTSDSSLETFNLNPVREYYNEKSLAELSAEYAASVDGNTLEMGQLMERPDLDPNDLQEDDLVMYMARGVDNFTIQYVGSEDPDLDREFYEWRPENEDIPGLPEDFRFSPLAFRFTFTLYDSRGVIEEGRTFTHIVYLGN